MKSFLAKQLAGPLHAGWQLIVMVALTIPAQTGHTQHRDSLLLRYRALWQSTGLTTSLTDIQFNQLFGSCDQSPQVCDSLLINLILGHYQQVSGALNADQKLALLRSFQPVFASLQHPDHKAMAQYYGLYLPAFRFHYQLDSIARYLDLLKLQLDQTTFPSEQYVLWLYEKGRLASQQGDYESGLNYSQHGLSYLRLHFPHLLRQQYLLQNAIGIAYRRLQLTDEAILLFEKILTTEWDQVHSVKMNGALLNNLGLAYKDCGDWADAITTLRKAIRYYQQHFSPTYEDIGSGYDNIAICYEAYGNPDSALVYSYKSIAFIRENLGDHHPDLLLPMNSITYTHMIRQEWSAAHTMNNQTLALLAASGWMDSSPEGHYYIADGFDVFAYRQFIFRGLYESTGDTADLKTAVRAGDHFMAMTDYAYDNLQNDISKDLFKVKHGEVFSACITDLYDLYAITGNSGLIEKAFGYAEKYKSLELLYAAQKDKTDTIPQYRQLNETHQAFIDSIRDYEAIRIDETASPEQQSHAGARLPVLKSALDLWKEKTKRDHPDYYQLIYHPEPVSISALQSALDSNQCILSYHVGKDDVYIIVILPHATHFVQEPMHADLNKQIDSLRTSINDYFQSAGKSEADYLASAKAFVHSSQVLYNQLLAPVKSLLSTRVIIIVDKMLGYVPFDALITQSPQQPYQFRDHAYVLREHAISYGYSCRLWMDMRAQPSRAGFSMLAMAPEFGKVNKTHRTAGSRNLQKLYYNESEVRAITSILKGKVLVKQHASKKNFLRHAAQYPIIHLATHSKANDEEGDHSYLAFTPENNDDGILYAGDIYGLHLQAELIALSACETGLGELRSGEGIISLARAFTFAGARSILSSLWAVNDQSTGTLMAFFYTHLRDGLPKDISLQQAKLDFLRATGHADAHPFYWAGFIEAGDMRSFIPASGPAGNTVIALCGIAGFLLVLFFLKKHHLLGTLRK